jgi:twitching motility protein PilI
MSKVIELQEDQSLVVAGLPYLSLLLDSEITVAIELKSIRETLVLASERFTQMPNVHPCLIGLAEHRSHVFWVLDLPQLLGLTPIDFTAIETHVAILQIADMFLGLGVYRIGRVQRIAETDIATFSNQDLPASAMPFIQGFVTDRTEGSEKKLYMLNTNAIIGFEFTDYKK